jgi:hypothetical protein
MLESTRLELLKSSPKVECSLMGFRGNFATWNLAVHSGPQINLDGNLTRDMFNVALCSLNRPEKHFGESFIAVHLCMCTPQLFSCYPFYRNSFSRTEAEDYICSMFYGPMQAIYAGEKDAKRARTSRKNLFKHENYIKTSIGTESTSLLFICSSPGRRDALMLQFNIYG